MVAVNLQQRTTEGGRPYNLHTRAVPYQYAGRCGIVPYNVDAPEAFRLSERDRSGCCPTHIIGRFAKRPYSSIGRWSGYTKTGGSAKRSVPVIRTGRCRHRPLL